MSRHSWDRSQKLRSTGRSYCIEIGGGLRLGIAQMHLNIAVLQFLLYPPLE